MNNTFRTNQMELILLFITAFFSAQRYLLPDIYHYACLIPLIAGIYFYKNSRILSNTFIFISLFTCVDIGGSSGAIMQFNETSSLIRYTIYLIIMITIVLNSKINFKRFYIMLLLLFFPLLSTIINLFDPQSLFNMSILRSDILVCFFLLLLFSNENNEIFKLELNLIFNFLIFFGLFEILNFMFFFNYQESYMNFQSTKSLILFPVFYSIVYSKSNFFKITLLILTVLILIGYVSRMIFLSMFLSLLFFMIAKILSGKIRLTSMLVYALLFFIVINFLSQRSDELQTIKMISTFTSFIDSTNFFTALNLIDPWRYGELQLFFDRDLLLIIFGEGFGSGVHDYNNYLYFAQFNQTAYTDKELITGTFYNMHDFWTDYGLRFGLLNITLFLFFLISKIIRSKNNNTIFIFMVSFVLTLCAFFSVSGIIMNFLILFNSSFRESNV